MQPKVISIHINQYFNSVSIIWRCVTFTIECLEHEDVPVHGLPISTVYKHHPINSAIWWRYITLDFAILRITTVEITFDVLATMQLLQERCDSMSRDRLSVVMPQTAICHHKKFNQICTQSVLLRGVENCLAPLIYQLCFWKLSKHSLLISIFDKCRYCTAVVNINPSVNQKNAPICHKLRHVHNEKYCGKYRSVCEPEKRKPEKRVITSCNVMELPEIMNLLLSSAPRCFRSHWPHQCIRMNIIQ